MPTYEFRCPRGHDFEKLYRTISGAEAQAACPQCGEVAARVMSATGFAFKGSGFYLTDYGKNAHRGSPDGKPAASGGGEAAGGGSAEGAAPAAAGGEKAGGEKAGGEKAGGEKVGGSNAPSTSPPPSAPSDAKKSPAEPKPAAPAPKKSSE